MDRLRSARRAASLRRRKRPKQHSHAGPGLAAFTSADDGRTAGKAEAFLRAAGQKSALQGVAGRARAPPRRGDAATRRSVRPARGWSDGVRRSPAPLLPQCLHCRAAASRRTRRRVSRCGTRSSSGRGVLLPATARLGAELRREAPGGIRLHSCRPKKKTTPPPQKVKSHSHCHK